MAPRKVYDCPKFVPLDFDVIWERYNKAVVNRPKETGRLRLTYDELKQVVLGGTDNE